MKYKLSLKLAVGLAAAVLTLGIATAALAHGEATPPPYAGMKNPFPWDDPNAQSQGKKLFEKSCAPCHGIGGGNLAQADFAASGFSDKLAAQGDHYIWVTSEGDMSHGMPPFKSSIAEDDRWRILTYMASLSHSSPAAIAAPVPAQTAGTLSLAIEDKRSAAPALLLTATLNDADGKPVSREDVSFFLKKDFFTQDWMQIGVAASNKDGKALLEYPLSENGNLHVVARQGKLEASGTWTVKTTPKGYQAEAGLKLPTIGPEVAVGLSEVPVEMNNAPTGGFRLPGGTLSWLLTFVGVVVTIWATYFRVFRQVLAIPASSSESNVPVKLVPVAAMCFVLLVGAMLAFIIVHGPYTHLNLAR